MKNKERIKIERKCDICESKSINVFLKAKSLDNLNSPEYKYLKCKKCGFVFFSNISDFSNSNNFDIYNESGYYGRKKERFKKFIDTLMRFFNRFRYLIVSKNFYDKKEGKLMDIGCGKGKFLVEARKDGWEVFGIEPTMRSSDIAINEYGLNVLQNYLSLEQFDNEFFDVITMWHVFEHIPDPNNVLQIAYNWLKYEGLLVMAVPNINSIQALFGKDLWFNLDPPRHLYHYSPETLKLILEKNGFTVKYISHFYPELNYFGLILTFINKIGCSPNFIFNFLKRNKKGLPKSSFILVRDIFVTILVLILLGLPMIALSMVEEQFKKGGSIVAIAKKSKE